jgi:hypothetical protein
MMKICQTNVCRQNFFRSAGSANPGSIIFRVNNCWKRVPLPRDLEREQKLINSRRANEVIRRLQEQLKNDPLGFGKEMVERQRKQHAFRAQPIQLARALEFLGNALEADNQPEEAKKCYDEAEQLFKSVK